MEAPCIPKLEIFLDEYIEAAGIAGDKDGPLFRRTGRSTGTPHRMTQQDAFRQQAAGECRSIRQSRKASSWREVTATGTPERH